MAAQPRPDLSHDTTTGSNKRQKVSIACDRCKSRKRKCDGQQPCSLCSASASTCCYDSPNKRSKHSHLEILRPGGVSISLPENAPLRSSRVASPFGDDAARGQYFGPTSTFSFLRRASDRLGRRIERSQTRNHESSSVSIFEFGDMKVAEPCTVNVPRISTKECHILSKRYFDFAAPTHRFLHEQTVERFVALYCSDDQAGLLRTQKAVVLLIFATALLYNVPNPVISDPSLLEADTTELREHHFQMAIRILNEERGSPRLESVQARLAAVLFMLHTSRLNQAWYMFGTTCQLIIAQGLHLSRSSTAAKKDIVIRESRKRCFWVAFTIDTYLSLMLGRPPLLSEQSADQLLPELLNDEDINADCSSVGHPTRDCVEAAPVFHAKLAKILRRALSEQLTVDRTSAQQQIDLAESLNCQILEWENELPPHLNGGIHPSSLIPVFERQLRVLQMGVLHATMVINRPLLTSTTVEVNIAQPYIEKCLAAARKVLHIIYDLVEDNGFSPTYWYFQHITFHALAIVYIWIISSQASSNSYSSQEADNVFTLAAKVQSHLEKSTRLNAASLRYNDILQELRNEVEAVSGVTREANFEQSAEQALNNSNPHSTEVNTTSDFEMLFDSTANPNFWAQLDTMAFDSGFNDLLADDFQFSNI